MILNYFFIRLLTIYTRLVNYIHYITGLHPVKVQYKLKKRIDTFIYQSSYTLLYILYMSLYSIIIRLALSQHYLLEKIFISRDRYRLAVVITLNVVASPLSQVFLLLKCLNTLRKTSDSQMP